MALDFLTLADPKLEKTYNARPAKDQLPARKAKLLDGIDVTLKQLAAKEANPTRGWYSTKGGVVRAAIKIGSKLLSLRGQDRFHIPAERAADFYKGVKAAVGKGELDADINAAYAPAADKGGAHVGGGDKPKRRMSPEHRAKIAAAAKARHAAKKGK